MADSDPNKPQDAQPERPQPENTVPLDPPRVPEVVRHTRILPEEVIPELEAIRASTAPLRPNQQIVLEIQGTPIRMLLVENMSILLGRSDVNIDPDVDLTLYGGVERGVSRVHARIQFRDGKLYLTDLGSNNGTYIGDKRLEAHHPELLPIGQTLMLGRLIIKVKTPDA